MPMKLSDKIKLLREMLDDNEYHICVSTENAVKILSENNWVVSFLSVDDLRNLNNKSKAEILNYAEKYYTVDNYRNFFMCFDDLIRDFKAVSTDKGYLKQLIRIEELLKDDFSNYIVLLSTAMGILEYKYIQKSGKLNTSKILKCKEIVVNHEAKQKSVTDMLASVDMGSTFGVLENYYKYGYFENGINSSKFGRHAVQHGRYNPERYKETDMIKTILLIYAIC